MRRVVVGVTAAAVVVGLVVLGTSGGEDVAVPPADASPEDVVVAYVAALNEGDRDAQRALRVDGAVGAPPVDPAPLGGRTTLVDVEVGPARDARPAGAIESATAVHVPVRFAVERTWGPFPPASPPDGTTGWGYGLQRESPSDPWRVASEGVG